MPVFDYECKRCNGRFEEVVLCGEEVEDVLPCINCEAPCERVVIYAFHVNGLEDHQLEEMESALFTKKQRAAGHKLRQSDNPLLRKRGEELRFRSNKDVRKFEEDRGWRRLTPGTTEFKSVMNQQLDQDSDVRKIVRTQGKEAAANFINKTDIMEKTGWSSSRYDRWRNLTDKVQSQTEVEVTDG